MGTAFLKAGFVGTIDFPMSVHLGIGQKDNKKDLWLQEHDFVVSAGSLELENTPNDELKTKMIPVIKPLADNLLSSF